MKTRISARHVLPATLLVLGLAACGRTQPAPAPAGQGTQVVHEMQGAAGMQMDSAVMRRHMQETDSMMARVRADVEQIRRLSPEEWPARLPEHLAVMDSMFAMMQRHMGGGGGMQHQHMGEGMRRHGEMHQQMMGGEMHQRMMGEMQALRADVDALRSASPAEVRERMPAHLERLERMLRMMEQMHGGGHTGM